MKCLTICQPYAHLIVTPKRLLPCDQVQKRVENRTWPTSYRGPLLIHAGRSRAWLRPGDVQLFPRLDFGKIVGVAELVECVNLPSVTFAQSQWLENRYPWLFSHVHTEGPYCWILENARRFDSPVPYRGRQGLFDVPDDVVAAQL